MDAQSVTNVEERALTRSPFPAAPDGTEKVKTVVVEHFPALGKLAALRFVEWAQANPGGVISLPTGKTPEHFIRWVTHLLEGWETREARKILEDGGVDPAARPDMRSLCFVQIDEFYPIDPAQHNSFFYYVNKFYIEGFGLDPAKALLINCAEIGLPEGETLASVWPENTVDLGLRYQSPASSLERKQKEVLERIDQWCQDYEDRIRGMGGIGFFLGGIGPDGHIGFNVRGSDHHSTTRLTPINYETRAAAAGDLGGIEGLRDRHVITIGLGTITFNPECVAIVIAAGETKARVVADAIEGEQSVLIPASCLHDLPGARFYVTRGAARNLSARRVSLLRDRDTVGDDEIERTIVDRSVAKGKPILDLSVEDFRDGTAAALVLGKRSEAIETLTGMVHDSLVTKIERGVIPQRETRFFHTEPHHDDIVLGYLPYVVRHVRDASNTHYFACMTSGFTSVTNRFMRDELVRLAGFLDDPEFRRLLAEGYFEPKNPIGRSRDVWEYLDGVASDVPDHEYRGRARRLLRDLIEVYEIKGRNEIAPRIQRLIGYFESAYPGKRDPDDVQHLKGMRREWEAECLWGYFGWNPSHVLHLRLGFYTGDIFTEEPTVERDVPPVLSALEMAEPDVVTVSLDPEASGPDTHYKVLQAITEALRLYEKRTGRSDIRVVGYRNVWHRFHPAEANIFVPVSLNMLAILDSAFTNAYITQRDASFPSHEHDGPFSELAQRIQAEQYRTIKTCLGRRWFHEHPSALIRATRGFVFLKEMGLSEFYQVSRELKQSVENR